VHNSEVFAFDVTDRQAVDDSIFDQRGCRFLDPFVGQVLRGRDRCAYPTIHGN
jgi:hypothetical protein